MAGGLPSLPKVSAKRPQPPRLRVPPAKPSGPRLFGQGRVKPHATDFFDPPPGFVGAHTSREEWVVYRAFAAVTGTPRAPRNPPYTGGATWTYQKAVEGGRQTRGGSVTDFVYVGPTGEIGVLLDTERWHVFAGPEKQATDRMLKARASRYMQIATIYSQDILGDPTGKAACEAVAKAIRGISGADVIATGTARRVRAGWPR